MDSKTLHILEYDKSRELLKAFCDFSASMELALALEPTDSYDLAIAGLAEHPKHGNVADLPRQCNPMDAHRLVLHTSGWRVGWG